MDQVGRAIRVIEDNLTKPLDVETVARFVGMSSSGFHAKFKEATSQSPMKFLKRLRLNRARNAADFLYDTVDKSLRQRRT